MERKQWFNILTRRAFDYFKKTPEAHTKIEAVFHLALVDAIAGADEIDALYLDWFLKGSVAEKLALAVMLEELRTFTATPALPAAVAAHRIADIRNGRQPVEKTLALAREALVTYRAQGDDLRICRVLGTIGTCFTELGDNNGAREIFLEAVVIGRKRISEAPEVIERLRNLCISLDNLGELESANGSKNEARRVFAESLAVRRKIAACEPANPDWQRLLALSLTFLGNLDDELGQSEAARTNFAESLEISRRLAAMDSNNTMWQQDLQVSLIRLGDLEQKQGQFEVARTKFAESLEISRRLVAMDSANTAWQHNLAFSLDRLGDLDTAQGRMEDARRYYAEKLDILSYIAALDPTNVKQQGSLALSHYKLAWFNREYSDEPGFKSELLACYKVLDQMRQHNQLVDTQLAQVYQQLAEAFSARLPS